MPREWQVESGVSVAGSTDDGIGHTQWTVPELTLRAGVTPRVELFLNATGFLVDIASEESGGRTTTGWNRTCNSTPSWGCSPKGRIC